jgi:ribosomal protein S15P/S13E
MAITREQKQNYYRQTCDNDTPLSDCPLTVRSDLADHLKKHKKDNTTKRFAWMVGKRSSFKYLDQSQ